MSELILPDYFSPIDLDVAFPRRAPVEIDVGCGEGAFLVEMARRHPERNFLGIELLRGRVGNACRAAARAGLANVRVLRIDTRYFICHLLPPASIAAFHILFPDPWPKRRHWRRRLVSPGAMDALHAALEPAGEVRVATDHAEYFAHIEQAAAACTGFLPEPWPVDDGAPQSGFERRYRSLELPIWRLRLRKA